jgi:excisionase family DNA binding protein
MKEKQLDFLSIKEFAKLLRVHPNTIRNAIKRGRISAFKVGGGKKGNYRIANTELSRVMILDMEKFIEKMIEERMKNGKSESEN